jgi:hypothetical protein
MVAPPLACDIDGDGRPERLVTVQTEEDGTFATYRIGLVDEHNRTLWSGPAGRNFDWSDPLVFYQVEGERLPVIFDDVDGDGSCEMIVAPPKSGLSLVKFDRFRWNGHGFDQLPGGILRQRHPPLGGQFVWEADPQENRLYTHWFVAHLTSRGDRKALATIYRVVGGPYASEVYRGEALLHLTRDGADLIRWIRAPSSIYAGHRNRSATRRSPHPALRAGSPGLRSPGKAPTGYRAKIGTADRYNSRGGRLYRLREILRQDRFRYYRYGGDPGESPDAYGFVTKSGRTFFERAKILPVNTTWRHLNDLVRYGSPLLNIRRRGNTLYVTVVSEN